MPTEIREDTLDQFPWELIETTFDDNGQIIGRFTLFDNQTDRVEEFQNGIRSFMIQTDLSAPGVAVPWQSIETFFDPAGAT